ncbi:MAG: ParB/RepB/Spo0J family partition protein [Planctomycetes bacterium]|nr:ParB/RepB/Spo0J family partition protein [Planctomycetota bacterium]
MVDRRLGRGLDFFLSGGRGSQPVQQGHSSPTEETLQVEVGALGPSPHQPRREFGETELQELAASIRANGILQPILARRVHDRYEIVAGERRWRAAKIAGLERVPVLIKPITDEESAVFGLVENLQREDLNAIEKAQAFRKLLAQLKVTQDDLAKRVGLDRSSVTNFLRLLDLPSEVQAHVSRGTLSMGHARCLLGLSDPAAIVTMADESIRLGWSVRELEQRVKQVTLGQAKGAEPAAERPRSSRPVWLKEIEETLMEALGTKVAVKGTAKKSKIVIECANRAEFDRVYDRLKNL